MNASAASTPLYEVIRLIHALSTNEVEIVELTAAREVQQRRKLEELQHGDSRRDELRGQVKSYIQARGEALKGPQLALMACHYLSLSGAETFPSRLVGSQIEEWTGGRPAHISSLMDTLKDRKQVEVHGEDGQGAHKSYSLTEGGRGEAERQLQSMELEKTE